MKMIIFAAIAASFLFSIPSQVALPLWGAILGGGVIAAPLVKCLRALKAPGFYW